MSIPIRFLISEFKMFGRTSGRAGARVAAVVAACGGAVTLASGGVARPVLPGAEEMRVRLPGSAAARLIVDDPGGTLSTATPIGEDDRVYLLSSRVVVKTGDAAALGGDAARLGAWVPAPGRSAGVAAVEGAPGYVLVEAGTVEAAAELATRLAATGRYASVEIDHQAPRDLRAPSESTLTNGTLWHLRNNTTPIADVNADGAWDLGYTGAGVTIGIVEAGFDQTHTDLAANFNATASQSVGSFWHTTGCAGIAAAVGNNAGGACGLAYGAQISEQDYGLTAADEAVAFGYRNDLVAVKSNSWGPLDNGTITDLPAVSKAAIVDAVTNGRGGLGTIFCWAAGNGGTNDRVDYDPYASSRYTFAIGAVSRTDVESDYNETGSSMLCVTQSSQGLTGTEGTYTTAVGGGYQTFGGTSSASPLGAGAVALALEANPALTWRDVMHLLAETARQCDPTDTSWESNAAGKAISYKFGFGAIDAGALCAAAETWTNVAAGIAGDTGVQTENAAVPDNNTTGLTFTATMDDDVTIETFELIVNVTTLKVGDMRIRVTSPSGTESVFTTPRGDGKDNLVDYVFTSYRSWGESSQGTWTLRVSDEIAGIVPTLVDWEIRAYGTEPVDPCPCDLTGEGILNLDDLDAFVSAFLAADPAADLTGEGTVNLDDLDAFIACYLGGCSS